MPSPCVFPRYKVHEPLLAEPEHSISLPRAMLDLEVCQYEPYINQYMWVHSGHVLIFMNDSSEPVDLVRACLIDEYGQQLVDSSLDQLCAFTFETHHRRWVWSSGDQLVDSGGAYLFAWWQ